jgi:hypothetical protein
MLVRARAVLSVEPRQHEPLSDLTVQVLRVPYHLQMDGLNKNFLSKFSRSLGRRVIRVNHGFDLGSNRTEL